MTITSGNKVAEIKETTNNGVVARILQNVNTGISTEQDLISVKYNFTSMKLAQRWALKQIRK